MITVSEQLRKLPAEVRPIVEAAIKAVRDVAPDAEEIPYRMNAPRSDRMMWKLVRYAVDGKDVVGVGTFPRHSNMFFYRGRELDPSGDLLQGRGKDARYVTLRSAGDSQSQAVKRLLRQAFQLAKG